MTRLSLWKFDEASSGTGPTSVADSDASPVNLAITYDGAAAWTAVTGYGDALSYPNADTATRCNASASSTKIATAFDGTRKTGTVACAAQFNTGTINSFYGALGVGIRDNVNGRSVLCLQLGDLGGTGDAELGLFVTTAATEDLSSILTMLANGYHVVEGVVDTTQATATNRAFLRVDGFLVASLAGNSLPAQNANLDVPDTVDSGALSADITTDIRGIDNAAAALYDNAATAANSLGRAQRWFAASGSDADPDTAGAFLRGACNGVDTSMGTNDVSSSVADHSISFTVVIGASGSKRKVQIPIAYMNVTTGVTSITFNGSATGVHLSAQQQSTFATLAGCDLYEILDADLPAAGTYTIAVTVDGATGVVCGSPIYLEGVAQGYATNVGLATGTGTSLTATLASPAQTGSIISGQMLDVSFGDAPVSAVNQLRLANQATSSVIAQTVDTKYVSAAGSNSLSWSGLTNTTGKIAIAIEAPVPQTSEAMFFACGTVG